MGAGVASVCARHWKTSEDEVPLFGAVATEAQGSERQGVRRAVGEVEPAVEREIFILSVAETPCGRADQTLDLGLARRLALEQAAIRESFQLR